jgi:hypothetical protein
LQNRKAFFHNGLRTLKTGFASKSDCWQARTEQHTIASIISDHLLILTATNEAIFEQRQTALPILASAGVMSLIV